MVAHLLRLRAALLFGALRGDSSQVVRAVVALCALAVAAIVGALGVLSLADTSTQRAETVLACGGSALVLAFGLAPALTRVEDPLDPRRFAVFGFAPRRLVMGVPVAAIISAPIAMVAALAVSALIVRIEQGASVALAVGSALLAVVTCALAARVGYAITAVAGSEDRRRSFAGLLAFVALAVGAPVGIFLITAVNPSAAAPASIAEILALTPFGAAWALPDPTANTAVVLIIAVVTPMALWSVWVWSATRLMTGVVRPSTWSARGGLGWFALFPGTPAGAIAARSMLYWLHDRRYLMNFVIVPVTSAISIVPLLVAGVPLEIAILVPVGFVSLFLGWLPHDDVAYDSTAVWMHVASNVHGVSDRLGRVAPILLFGTPTLAIVLVLSVAVHGDWSVLPAMIGLCTALYLSGLGLSSIASVLAPYAVTRPGDSPFRQPQRTGSSGVIAQGAVLVGSISASAPALVWTWRAAAGDSAAALPALGLGVGIGLSVFVAGVMIGGELFRRRGERLLEVAEAA